MPREITGQQPVSKSQKNKWLKRRKVMSKQYGGICSKCGQTSTSSTPGSIHVTCGEPTKDIAMLYSIGASVLRPYLSSDGQGKWLSKDEHERYKADIQTYMANLRNFNTVLNRWENGYGEPIDFKTREVLLEKPSSDSEWDVSEALTETAINSTPKISIEMDVEPAAETERVTEQVAA